MFMHLKELLSCASVAMVAMTISITALPAAHAEQPVNVSATTELPEIKKTGPVFTFTLANGLQVVVIENHRAPVVTQMVWYKVGSADEPQGVTGIAHFLEHLMFKGTQKHPAGEFTKTIAKIGGEENAFTYYDYTAYYQSVASQYLPTIMEFEADRMTNLVLNDDTIDSERKVIIEERRMRTDNNPAAILSEQTRATLFLNSPYRNPVIGWKQEMEKLSKADAIAFYEKYYTPNNATLVLSGDVTPDQARDLALATYGKITPRAQAGARIRPQEPKNESYRTVTMHDPRVTVPQLQHMWVVPSYHNATDKKQAAALDLLGEILGSAPLGRLYQNFIVEKGTAAGVGAGYAGSAVDDGIFYFYVVPRGNTSLDELKQSTTDMIADIAKNGVSADELNQARNRFIKNMIFALDSPVGMAQLYGASMTIGMSAEDVTHWPDLLKSVAPDDIRKVAQQYLKSEFGVTSYLLPPAVEAKQTTVQNPENGNK